MVERVVVGIDGSVGSVPALCWAVEEAAVREALPNPVTVWQSPYDFGKELAYPVAEQKNAAGVIHLGTAVAESLGDEQGLVVEASVLRADPAQTPCHRSGGADLLVVGSRGHGGFASLLLGSVSLRCSRHSHCPVAIAHDAVSVRRDPHGTEMTLECQGPYFRRDRTARLERTDEQLAEAVTEAVTEAVRATPTVAVDRVVVDGDPAEVLCARAADADLLVVGSPGHGGFGRLLLGSASSDCAHHSCRPIVIVSTPHPDLDGSTGS